MDSGTSGRPWTRETIPQFQHEPDFGVASSNYELVDLLLFENELKHRHDAKEINARQYAIVSQVLNGTGPLPIAELRRAPCYLALYTQRTDKTKQRDLRRLREQKLLILDKNNLLWPGFVESGIDKTK